LINREVGNILGQFGPAFRMFAPTVSNYIEGMISPYIDAFMGVDSQKINTKAAGAFLKSETNKKIEEFMKAFESESGNV
jgi:hypothetical protein